MNKKTQHYRFVQNQQCEYFPCHQGIPAEDFNCLFCYCPLYALGRKCGGHFTYNAGGCKDCSQCTIPHRRDNYERIIARYGDIMDVVARMDKEKRG
ncbi:MAG: cysteine-rich small domain-containing protein [Clostridia bacterium]|nr:cysteine-rich small domain-containing protein [Clostridia bacterium]